MRFLKDDTEELKLSNDAGELFSQIGVMDWQKLFDFATISAVQIIQMINPNMVDKHVVNIKRIWVFYHWLMEFIQYGEFELENLDPEAIQMNRFEKFFAARSFWENQEFHVEFDYLYQDTRQYHQNVTTWERA